MSDQDADRFVGWLLSANCAMSLLDYLDFPDFLSFILYEDFAIEMYKLSDTVDVRYSIGKIGSR